jgi:hypothetical protein
LSRFDHPEIETDFRLPHYRQRLVPALAQHFPLDGLASSLYFSPSLAQPGAGAFAHLRRVGVKVWVQYSDCELFADDVRALVVRMRAEEVDVKSDEVYGGLHADAVVRRALALSSVGATLRAVLGLKSKRTRSGMQNASTDDSSWGRFVNAVKAMGW